MKKSKAAKSIFLRTEHTHKNRKKWKETIV